MKKIGVALTATSPRGLVAVFIVTRRTYERLRALVWWDGCDNGAVAYVRRPVVGGRRRVPGTRQYHWIKPTRARRVFNPRSARGEGLDPAGRARVLGFGRHARARVGLSVGWFYRADTNGEWAIMDDQIDRP